MSSTYLKLLGIGGSDGSDLSGDFYTLSPDTFVSSSQYATEAFTSESYVLEGGKWGTSQVNGTPGGVVTWSLMANGTAIEASLHDALVAEGIPQTTVNGLSTFLYSSFETQLRAAFAAWSAVANITFIEVADGGGQAGSDTFADIRVGGLSMDGYGGTLAFTFTPDPIENGAAAGDIYFDTGDASFFAPQSLFLVAAHEIGHSLGLDHSTDPNVLMYPVYNGMLSGLTSDDIAGAQAIYGAASAPGTPVTYSVPVGQTTLTIVNGVANLTINANSSGDAITGSSFAEVINGGIGNDTLNGGAGDDSLDGGAGNDSLVGGAGNDTFVVDSVSDVVRENANEGTDTVISSITYALGSNLENLTLTAVGVIGTGNALANVLTANANNQTLIGGTGDDTYVIAAGVTGTTITENAAEGTDTVKSASNYTLSANFENLTLTGSGLSGTGNSSDNVLTANANNDTLVGGAGNDTYVIAAGVTGTSLVENFGEGIDTVLASANYTLAANIENVTVTGTSVAVTGNALDNILTTNALYSILAGGDGNDTYILNAAAFFGGDPTVVELANGGTDTVYSAGSLILRANIENLTLFGNSFASAFGNSLDNVITGDASGNQIDGSAGADTMIGGAGNDSYSVDNAGDVVIENAGEGTDTVTTGISYTLTANVENLRISGTGLTGTGNSLNNELDGQNADSSTLIGGAGDDLYRVSIFGDTIIIENPGEGIDTVEATSDYTLSANVENLRLNSTGDYNLTGNDLANVIQGLSGKNVLDGGLGADTLIGGVGNDTYVVDNVGDVVTENANEGTDTVQSSISYTLGANLENLTLLGSSALDGTGNASSNYITGNSANNVLVGGLGDDTLVGNGGNDTFKFQDGDGHDTITDFASGDRISLSLSNFATFSSVMAAASDQGANVLLNFDAADSILLLNVHKAQLTASNFTFDVPPVTSSQSFALPDGAYNLTLTGNAPINGTGNALDNVITGNSATNIIDGGTGADTMIGGAGDDIYYVDNSGDVVTENGGDGNDWVYTTLASYTLPTNVEIVTLNAIGPANAYGNAGDNVMFGNIWNNYFDGGAGGDFMAGGPGDDAYWVDSASDVVYEKPGEGGDTIVTVINYQLFAGSDVEAIVMLDQGGNINAVGSDFDNLIQGNNFDNVIVGRGGNDRLWGFAGADRFIFQTGDAHDTIYDYNNGQGDYLDIRVSGYTTVAQILAAAHDDGTNTTIQFNATDAITLNNITVAQLSASDFLIIPP